MALIDPQWAMRVMSGEDRGGGAALLRTLLTAAEQVYAQAMNLRNWCFDHGILRSHPLPRPVVSVGNITTGGTGKTPIVRWLAEHLIARGLRPAILMRGYRANQTAGSDEEKLLAEALGDVASVVANADRIAGAMEALSANAPPDVFLLDDAFQHRRVQRDFNLMLLDAAEPFGFDHVLPRGLLREPLHGLHRADAAVLTRADQATSQQLQSAQARLRRWLPADRVFQARHAITGLRSAAIASTGAADIQLAELSSRPYFAFAGIANPTSLQKQLAAIGGRMAGFRAFPDHHGYSQADLDALSNEAASAGANALVTTEKDWVKLRAFAATSRLPLIRLDLKIEFNEEDGDRLLQLIVARIEQRRTSATTPATPGPWRA